MTSQVFRAAGSRSNTTAISSFRRANIIFMNQRQGPRTLRCPSKLVNLSAYPFLRVGKRLHHPAHDVDLLLLELGAAEQPPQPCHQLLRAARVQEAGLEQALLQVLVE